MKRNIIHSSVAAVLLGLSGAAMADGSAIHLSELAERSGMVFEGTVRSIEYGTHAGPYEEDGAMPYTYVTYEINNVLMGESENKDTVTLRYEGGVGEDGSIMLASHTPLFDEGDTDILFVSDKRLPDCPLVDCKQSRFRVINGKMYNYGGRQIVSGAKGALRAGVEERLPEVFQNQIGKFKLEFESLLDPGEEDAGTQLKRAPLEPGSIHLSKDQFTSLLGKTIKSRISPQRLQTLSAVKDDNILSAPSLKRMKAGLPPAVK